MDWSDPDEASGTPAEPGGPPAGGSDPYAPLRNLEQEPFATWEQAPEPGQGPPPEHDPSRPPLSVPPMAHDTAPEPPPEQDDRQDDQASYSGADFMAAATISAVLEQLAALGPRLDALEAALRSDALAPVRASLDHLTQGVAAAVSNTEHLGDVVAEASRVAVAPLAADIGADVARRLQDVLGDLILPVNERLAAIDASLAALVAPVNRRLEELSMRVDAIEGALRVLGGRLTQSTHLQPAMESLRRDVAQLSVKSDPRGLTTGLVRLVRDAVAVETAALVRDVGLLQGSVDQLRTEVRAQPAAAPPAADALRSAAPRSRVPLEIEPEPVRRTVRPPVPEPEGASEHPWWREA